MHGVINLSRPTSRPPIGETLSLPPTPEELTAAETEHADIGAALVNARADMETLSANFNLMGGLRRADGTLFPNSGREGILGSLMGQCADLEAAKEEARRRVDDARRAFSLKTSREITPAADAVAERAVQHVEEAMHLLEQLSDLAAEARRSGIRIQHRQVEAAAGLVRQLHSLRGQLVPTPSMGRR